MRPIADRSASSMAVVWIADSEPSTDAVDVVPVDVVVYSDSVVADYDPTANGLSRYH